MTDITPVLETVVTLILAVVTAAAMPFLNKYIIPWIDAKITADKTRILASLAETAVMAAEEAARTGKIFKAEKFDYAAKIIRQNGFDLDTQKLTAVINAAVYNIINNAKEVENGESA